MKKLFFVFFGIVFAGILLLMAGFDFFFVLTFFVMFETVFLLPLVIMSPSFPFGMKAGLSSLIFVLGLVGYVISVGFSRGIRFYPPIFAALLLGIEFRRRLFPPGN